MTASRPPDRSPAPDGPRAPGSLAGGWFLAFAAAAFWVGVLGAGRLQASVGRAAALAAAGLVCLLAPVIRGFVARGRGRARAHGGTRGAAAAAVLLAGFAALGAADAGLRAAHLAASPLTL